MMAAPNPFAVLRKAVEAQPPAERAAWLAAHLAAQPAKGQAYAWHVAEGLIVGQPAVLHAAASRMIEDPLAGPHATLALARLLHREEAFGELRALILRTLDRPPLPRVEWLRALARTELLAPSPEAASNWRLALAEQPPLDRRALRLQREVAAGRPADPDPLLEASARAMARIPPGVVPVPEAARSIAIVGNGSSLKGGGAGAAIERHDLVIRLNYPPLAGHERDAGRRTDLMLFHENKRPNLAALLAREPEYPTIPAFAVRGFAFEGPARSGPPRIDNALVGLVGAHTYSMPTTGMFAIILASVLLRRQVSLFGFFFFAPSLPVHYFGSGRAASIHEVAYERWYATNILPLLGLDLIGLPPRA